jgi:prepilin-type N-terminal cleavage/methylation domain-containing protein
MNINAIGLFPEMLSYRLRKQSSYKDWFMHNRKAFTLIELLIVISILALLIGILLPVLGRARLRAKVVVVSAELYQIGLGLEMYGIDNNNKFPPTRADCNPTARKHVYALPQELSKGNYLPGGQIGPIRFADIEDKFYKDCAYKYIAAGPMYDYHGTPFGNQPLYIPEGFPDNSGTKLIKYEEPDKSPVSWVLFSVGPRFDIDLESKTFPINKGYPIKESFWYSPKKCKGAITQIRLKKSMRYVGSFEEKND